MPNAGLPRFVGGRFLYLASPEYMAEYASRFAAAGAALIGGCCGTTPAHIRRMRDALRAAVDPAAAATRVPDVSPLVVAPPPERVEAADPSTRSALAAKLAAGSFVMSVEVDPPRGVRPRKMIEGAQMLKQAGIDAINIADSPMARVRMSSLALATMITHQVGIETILHFTCRDRNLMGIQSDLMGAHALGIRNILALTGDPPSVGDFPGATAVYDVDSIGLIGVLRRLNAGTDLAGNSIGEPTRFVIGCAVNPMAEDRTAELDRFRRKIDAGAEFAMTQPLYEQEPLLEFLERLGKPHVPILLGLLPLQSHRHAEFLHNEVPGIVIPDWARKAMREAGDRGVEIGIEMCRSLLLEARDRVAGAYLMPSFGRYEVVARVAEAVRPVGGPRGSSGTGQIA
jgi:homocysteine S-methyltransferase